MVQNFLKKIEEKYVFNISQYFWHIFITIASLGMLVGLGYVFWGIIPPSKTTVTKGQYPAISKVTFEELNKVLSPPKAVKGEVKNQPKEEKKPKVLTATVDNEYNKVLDSLKDLLPEPKFSWNPAGYYYSPYGYFSSERRWVETSPGINRALETTYSNLSLSSYPQKSALVRMYNKFLTPIGIEDRAYALGSLLSITNTSLEKTGTGISLLNKAAQLFTKDKYSQVYRIAQFIKNNPNDGFPFAEYSTTILPKFSEENRPVILGTMIQAYGNYFNNKIDYQKELTDNFLGFSNNFDTKNQGSALEQYYRMSVRKNRDRENEIVRIDDKFESEKATAEQEFLNKQVKKSDFLWQGARGLGGGIALISIIALLLVLLSIQRYLKSIDSKLTVTPEKISEPVE